MADNRSHRGWYHPRALPHFDSPERVQFVTFRLVDSLPLQASVRGETPDEMRRRHERELDEGRGACWLSQPSIAAAVAEALLAFDGQRYRLHAWCIMPNHVHCLFEAIDGHRLADVVWSWKIHGALQGNRLLGRTGAFWQRDYFDRYMRDEIQIANAAAYIERNPVQAGLCREPADWRWSSAWKGA